MKKKILLIIAFFCFLGLVYGQEIDSKAVLIKGKNDIEAGKYAEAVESLSIAYRRVPVVGDYILFWLSKAYRELGNIPESNSRIKELFKSYPDSPLRKKARSMEIQNIMSSNEIPNAMQVFESYVKDYPDDYEIKFLFGQVLKNQGKTERAKVIFRNIYVNCPGIFSKVAYNELFPSDITVPDLIERASTLMDVMEFKEAETVLRTALQKVGIDSQRDDGRHKAELLKKIGRSVFKQKRYREAAEIYEKTWDYYSRALALYRAGERAEFNNCLKKLVSAGDKKAGSLLIMSASEKRRNNKFDEAVEIFKDIKTNYPSEAESALWGIGWTYYRSGDYQKALDAFTDLSSIYGNSKYLYWKAQSLEGLGKDAGSIYKQLAEKEQDFYGALARLRNNQLSVVRAQYLRLNASDPRFKSFQSERVDILIELGMKKEAVTELSAIARKTTNPDELSYVCSKLQEAGEYRLALNLAAKLPDRGIALGILYPLAHWDVVKEASARHGVDPFVVLSIMREESRFDSDARSEVGALGLMQLMPQTASLIDKKISLNIKSREQIYDVKINIALGSYYINSLIKDFGSVPAAVAAYNAGDEIVRKWQKAGNYKSVDEFIEDIPYDETKNFTKRVITSYFEYLKSTGEKDMPKIL